MLQVDTSIFVYKYDIICGETGTRMMNLWEMVVFWVFLVVVKLKDRQHFRLKPTVCQQSW